MSDEPTPVSEGPSPFKDETPPEPRPQRAPQRSRRGVPWLLGAILIVAGIFLLLQQLDVGAAFLNNWWALFILIPTVGAFERAAAAYRDAGGQLTAAVTGAAIAALVLTGLTLMLLFNLQGALLWPAMLILGGIALLLNSMRYL